MPIDKSRQMMQRLLADRFQLTFHRESREMPVYVLAIASKNGAQLTAKGLQESAPDAKSGMRVGFGQNSQILATKSNMERLVTQLSGGMDRPVLDKTGLNGDYDFKLEWSVGGANSDAPSIFTALQEQLGLNWRVRKRQCMRPISQRSLCLQFRRIANRIHDALRIV